MKEAVFHWYANLYATVVSQLQIGTPISQIFTGTDKTYFDIETAILNFLSKDITNVMSSIAIAIATLFFVISLLDLAMTDRFTLEYFIKFCSKFAVSLILIVMCSDLTKLISDFAASFCGAIGPLIKAGTDEDMVDVAKTVYESLMATSTGFFNKSWIMVVIAGLLNMGILSIFSLILLIVVYLVAFTRLMEMSVRASFMPIAFALLADDGWRGAGGRYIRKYLAICCQSVVLCMIGGLHSIAFDKLILVFNTNIANGGAANGSVPEAMLFMFGLSFATISLMFKSIGIVNDVFGA